MHKKITMSLLSIAVMVLSSCKVEKSAGLQSQNPSPMNELIRPHDRVSAITCVGMRTKWEVAGKEFQLFEPFGFDRSSDVQLIIHFHGAPEVSEFAICNNSSKIIVTVSGGSGSSSYKKLFFENNNFNELLNKVKEKLEIEKFASITLSGWSAGYGAIRTILSINEEKINNIILLDGIHASYVPDGKLLHDGGKLNTTDLSNFLRFAKRAVDGEKKMIITHSFIFPGTYASTTECTQYLLDTLKLKRIPVLKQGPMGMQQLAESISGNLQILSYAGNTAPDHVDHLHGLGYFLDRMLQE